MRGVSLVACVMETVQRRIDAQKERWRGLKRAWMEDGAVNLTPSAGLITGVRRQSACTDASGASEGVRRSTRGCAYGSAWTGCLGRVR